jgi:hypothetical protein
MKLDNIQKHVDEIHSNTLDILASAKLDRATKRQLRQIAEEAAEVSKVIAQLRSGEDRPLAKRGGLARFIDFLLKVTPIVSRLRGDEN